MQNEGCRISIHQNDICDIYLFISDIFILCTCLKIYKGHLSVHTSWDKCRYYAIPRSGWTRSSFKVDITTLILTLIYTVILLILVRHYDYVECSSLWLQLIRLGIRGKMINIIRSMYQNVRYRLKYNNNFSDSFECYIGV